MADWRLDFQPTIMSNRRGLDAFDRALEYRAERDRQKNVDAMQERRVKMEELREANRDRREKGEYDLRLADRRKGLVGEVSKLASKRRHSEARALAKASQVIDPRTGEMVSLDYDPGDIDDEASGPDVSPKTPSVEPTPLGPRSDATKEPGLVPAVQRRDDALAPVVDPSRVEPPGMDWSRVDALPRILDPFGKTRGAPTGAMAQAPEQGRQKEATPDLRHFSSFVKTGSTTGDMPKSGPLPEAPRPQRRKPAIILPGGERIEIDLDEAKRFEQEEANEKKERMMGLLADPTLPPDLKRAIALRAGLTGVQATGAEGAQIMGAEGREDAQTFKAEESAKYDLTAAQQMDLAIKKLAQRKGAGGKGSSLKKEKDQWEINRKIMVRNSAVDSAIQQVMNNEGYKEIRGEQDMLGKINNIAGVASVNSAASALLRGWYARFGQGAGVLTESDLNTFYNNVGSLAERLGIRATEVLSGTPTEDKVQLIKQALEQTLQQSQSRRHALGDKLITTMLQKADAFNDPEDWKLQTAGYLRKFSPTNLKAFEETYGAVDWDAHTRKLGLGVTGGGATAPTGGGSPTAGGKPLPQGGGANPEVAGAQRWLASPEAQKNPKQAERVRAMLAQKYGVR